MNLFDIKSSLYELLENGYNEECVDPETGEFDEEKAKALLDGYQEEFACKVDGIAQYIQELNARADAIRNKAAVLTERARRTENKAEGLKRYLGEALGYKKYESDAVKIGFRKSVSVKVDESALPAEYFTVKEDRQPDKTAIKAALLGGAVISGATLEEKQNIQIK